jgi:hypothetical protein
MHKETRAARASAATNARSTSSTTTEHCKKLLLEQTLHARRLCGNPARMSPLNSPHFVRSIRRRGSQDPTILSKCSARSMSVGAQRTKWKAPRHTFPHCQEFSKARCYWSQLCCKRIGILIFLRSGLARCILTQWNAVKIVHSCGEEHTCRPL